MSGSATSLFGLQPLPPEELFMHSGGGWGHWVKLDHVQDINCGSSSQELWPGALVDTRGEGSPQTKEGGLPGLACWSICKSRWQILFGQEAVTEAKTKVWLLALASRKLWQTLSWQQKAPERKSGLTPICAVLKRPTANLDWRCSLWVVGRAFD